MFLFNGEARNLNMQILESGDHIHINAKWMARLNEDKTTLEMFSTASVTCEPLMSAVRSYASLQNELKERTQDFATLGKEIVHSVKELMRDADANHEEKAEELGVLTAVNARHNRRIQEIKALTRFEGEGVHVHVEEIVKILSGSCVRLKDGSFAAWFAGGAVDAEHVCNRTIIAAETYVIERENIERFAAYGSDARGSMIIHNTYDLKSVEDPSHIIRGAAWKDMGVIAMTHTCVRWRSLVFMFGTPMDKCLYALCPRDGYAGVGDGVDICSKENSTFDVMFSHYGLAADNHVIYMTGGVDMLDANTDANVSPNARVIDPLNMQAYSLPDMITPRYSHQLCVVGNELCAIGGYTKSGAGSMTSSVECLLLNDQSLEWRACVSMPTPRAEFAALVVDEHIWVIGGYTYDEKGIAAPTKSVLIFDSRQKTWKAGPLLQSPDMGGTAVLLKGSNILYVGECGIHRFKDGLWTSLRKPSDIKNRVKVA